MDPKMEDEALTLCEMFPQVQPTTVVQLLLRKPFDEVLNVLLSQSHGPEDIGVVEMLSLTPEEWTLSPSMGSTEEEDRCLAEKLHEEETSSPAGVYATSNQLLGQLAQERRARAKSKATSHTRSTASHARWYTTSAERVRVWTLTDLKRKEVASTPSSDRGGGGSNIRDFHNTFYDPTRIGHEALDLTNGFRKEQGKSPLHWNQELANIAQSHSRNMGEGVVPFGHGGFGDRASRASLSGLRENVAMNQGTLDVAQTAVSGWISSPGHRRNLLAGGASYCGIGVFQNARGMWYLTQLIGQ